ncbi:pleckstrin homology domain-containing family G member 7 [Monodelphis domestica]|uniref:pleckstrin homology domain-containing family G member 7 n=1 Tax=Monodelphis domestica TaxID=13616 RepID=UPI0024E27853|nr:pleckstrin homology domain-containing family G member 7 [Monodelphis domestica]XP_007503270.2 pleckstrin homology domain-containing family G member 7 [Monodelphis domestica]
MQQPSPNYALEPNEEARLNVEKEKLHHSGSSLEDSDSESILRAPSENEIIAPGQDKESSNTPIEIRGHGGCPNKPQKSPSPEYTSGQGNLFQFDRQAPGRISTSPTLRRLRSSTSQLPSHQDSLETFNWKNWKGTPGSLSKSLPRSPKACSKSLSSLNLSSKAVPHLQTTIASFDFTNSKTSWPCPTNSLMDNDACPGIQANNMAHSNHASLSGKEHPSQSRSLISNQWNQGEESYLSRFYQHRRSSVVVNLPGLEVFPGDLLVPDGVASYLYHPSLLLNSEPKKLRWPFSKKGGSKDKQKQAFDLENCLSTIKIPDYSGYEFHSLKDKTWEEVLQRHQKLPGETPDLRKQQEAVWELFTSECTYYLDHLLVLKMIFMNTLKYLQSYECLLDVDLWRLFANLEELSQVSLGFVSCFFSTIKAYINSSGSTSSMDFISVLSKHFRGSLCQSHQVYCLNYTSTIFYLESLRQREDFGIYLKWCERHNQCKRLHLPELLVTPLHRLTRYPLLLKNIWKRSTDAREKITIYSLKEKVEKAIRDLEGKVKWLDNFQKFRHLQEIIVWPPLWDRDKRFFIPECLKHIFKEHMAESILSPANRHLLHEGKLTLAESTRFLDVYLFLFDDFLLITKTKHSKKKLGGSDLGLVCPSLTPELQAMIKEGGSCTVLDQPIPLDRLVVKSIDPFHVSVFGLRNAFLLQHENRYQQCIAAFLLQAQTEAAKKTWMAQITTAASCYMKRYETKKSSCTLPAESSEI